MKKAAVLWSSPNMDGLTASAKEQFIRGLEDAGEQVEEIHLNTKKLEHCRACGNGWGTCNKSGACVIKDDFEEVYRTISSTYGFLACRKALYSLTGWPSSFVAVVPLFSCSFCFRLSYTRK